MTPRARPRRSGRVIVARPSLRARARAALRIARWLGLGVVLCLLGCLWWFVIVPDLPTRLVRPVVNDVTQLNPVPVARIAYPHTLAELQTLVRRWPGPIAIGGGHYSMGGQTACERCLSLDMRQLDHVLEFDVAKRSIKVEAGITWQKVQAAIDPVGLAVSIMQTYANFTVGGTLSVNAHGRYVGGGPVIRSVLDIDLVLADGRLVHASPRENAELFYGAIGGYGGLGVIVAARLALAENTHVERSVQGMPLTAYPEFFASHVRDDPRAVFHNADLYPPAYDFVRAQTWSTTDRALTNSARFVGPGEPARLGRLLDVLTEVPFGQSFRRYIYDPLFFAGDAVVWRNHEASYDVAELEPSSRRDSTYVLQEYFVPPERLSAFVPQLRRILQRRAVRAVNISIRHALPDSGSLLAWARGEVFSLVLFYKQGTDAAARRDVASWTREAIDAALAVGGSYYLPYQAHATLAQLQRAYPRFQEFAALKQRVDPQYRFRNKLWDKYLPPQDAEALARRKLHEATPALRAEAETFLTLPKWQLVFTADEYATHLTHAPPSAFPYLASTRQYWSLYRDAFRRVRHRYPSRAASHWSNIVSGIGFSVENVLKSAYENTVGRVSEWFACHGPWQLCSAEDRYAAETARGYERFIRSSPWYEFPYQRTLRGLWSLDSRDNPSWIRTGERRMFLSLEYGSKAVCAAVARTWSRAAAGPGPVTTLSWIRRPSRVPLPAAAISFGRFGDEELAWLPRYQSFSDAVATLIAQGGDVREIAGNDHVALTWITPRGFRFDAADGEVTLRWPLLTDSAHERVLMFTPVAGLSGCLPRMTKRGAKLDHIFDY